MGVDAVSERVLALAEHSNAYTPLERGQQRLEDPRFVIWLGRGLSAHSTVVQRLRLSAGEVEQTVDDVRTLLGRLERRTSSWEVSTSATPPDLAARLEGLGLVPDREPYVVSMVLTDEPPRAPAGFEVRPVANAEEYVAALRVQHIAFETPEDARERELEDAARNFRLWEASPDSALFLAWLDGEPVAAGRATFADAGAVLNGGATLPEARGRGAYRALVAARWDEAARRGTPALITQAGAMSRPILRRLGFREVAEIRVLVDEPR
jgi:GNAT superfamily N-acetyltransferase